MSYKMTRPSNVWQAGLKRLTTTTTQNPKSRTEAPLATSESEVQILPLILKRSGLAAEEAGSGPSGPEVKSSRLAPRPKLRRPANRVTFGGGGPNKNKFSTAVYANTDSAPKKALEKHKIYSNR